MILKLLILILLIENQLIVSSQNNAQIKSNTTKINTEKISINKNSITKTDEEQPIGYIKIQSINLNNKIYSINSKHNNIEENITILKSSNYIERKDSLIILAAHSGTGKTAYFNNLNKLSINDQINFKYYNKDYTFTIINIFEQNKDGHINISKKNKSQLILTTCSTTNKNKQLIIESIIKES